MTSSRISGSSEFAEQVETLSTGSPVLVYVLSGYPILSETFVRNEVQALRASGVEVRVYSLQAIDATHVTPSWSGPWQVWRRPGVGRTVKDYGWWLGRHPGRLVRMLAKAWSLRERRAVTALATVPGIARELATLGVRGCHTHFAWEGVPVVVLLGSLLSAPTSVTVHAKDIYVRTTATRRRLAMVDEIVTVCRYNVEYMHSRGITEKAIRVVPCGVELPGSVAADPVDPLLAICVARLVPKKGVDVLLRAMAIALADCPDARLDIIGDGPLRGELEALRDYLGLSKSVRFLGSRSSAESLEAIGQAAVFALACRVPPDGDTDALPVVLREAMIRARPVVTTAVAGIPEVVDEATGWIVPPDDPNAFAAALVAALSDPVERTRRGTAASARVRVDGTIAATTRGMRDIFGLERQ
jgi:colanic acid/amylovoran biosynthesis glycosyltransferase